MRTPGANVHACSCGATVGESPQKCQECGAMSRPWPFDEYEEAAAAMGALNATKPTCVLTAEQWLTLSVEVDDGSIAIGSGSQPIVRTSTKNLIEAPEKAFKTSFLLRLSLGVSCGITVYQSLPVPRPRKVLYIHGELSDPEIKERTQSAVANLPRPLDNFYQVRDLYVHLVERQGQNRLRKIIQEVRPDDLVLDPYQSFISGCDENEFKEISLATRFIDRLIDEFKLTVYLATHTGKDKTRGTRGHSSLAGWRDTLFKLERKGKTAVVTVTVEPRWAAPPDPFSLRLDKGTLVEDGFQIPKFTKQAESIREVVETNGGKVSRAAIGQALGLSAEALRQALNRAAHNGAIKLVDEDVTL